MPTRCPMWTTTEVTNCSECKNKILCKTTISVCISCLPIHWPKYDPKSVAFSTYSHQVQCGACGSARTNYQLPVCSLWVSFCVPCGVPQSGEYAASQNNFLKLLDPSPLDYNFSGDVSLIVEDTEIQAHRFILGSKSPVFKKMVEVDMKEKNTGKVHMEGFSAAVVRAVVNCMYTADISFNDDATPQEVLKFAHQYEIMWLKDVCDEVLTKTISDANLVNLLAIAYKYQAEKLKTELKLFFSAAKPNIHANVLDGIFEELVKN